MNKWLEKRANVPSSLVLRHNYSLKQSFWDNLEFYKIQILDLGLTKSEMRPRNQYFFNH